MSVRVNAVAAVTEQVNEVGLVMVSQLIVELLGLASRT